VAAACVVSVMPVMTPVARRYDEVAFVGVGVPGKRGRIAPLSPDFADNVSDPQRRHDAQVDQEFCMAGQRRPPFTRLAALGLGYERGRSSCFGTGDLVRRRGRTRSNRRAHDCLGVPYRRAGLHEPVIHQ
jgi:hypothetical protein